MDVTSAAAGTLTGEFVSVTGTTGNVTLAGVVHDTGLAAGARNVEIYSGLDTTISANVTSDTGDVLVTALNDVTQTAGRMTSPAFVKRGAPPPARQLFLASRVERGHR